MARTYKSSKSLQERFWEKIDKTPGRGPNGECWVWIASFVEGYGSFGLGNGKVGRSHRVSYEMHYGNIPAGLHVLHSCDNRACCRPDHLFLGTNSDNVADRVAKGRSAFGNRNAAGGTWSRGERNCKAKLTIAQVKEIRERRAKGEILRTIAQDYNISLSQVGRIANGKFWKQGEI